MSRNNARVDLKVRDRGVGIPAPRLLELNQGGSGVGIRGMRFRVGQLNGDLTISSDETGTTVAITLPVQNEEHYQGGELTSVLNFPN